MGSSIERCKAEAGQGVDTAVVIAQRTARFYSFLRNPPPDFQDKLAKFDGDHWGFSKISKTLTGQKLIDD